jgi:glyoxylase-like metal-dependent hydrolase (beta-lactamase superfamily II)
MEPLTMDLDDLSVIALSDGEARVPPDALLDKPAEAWAPHAGLLDADGNLHVNFGGFLIRTATRTIVVDCGIGAGARPDIGVGTFRDNLRAAGVAPADVTDVIFTHLHFDHVGWATDGRRVLFDGATHWCHALDWSYFCGEDPAVEDGPGMDDFGAIPAPERLAPLAGRMTLLHGETTEVAPGVEVRLAPGHSPGHCIVVLRSGDAQLALLADAAHSPVELLEDDWSSPTDVDPELARRTRAALAGWLAASGTPATMTHDGGNRFGRVIAQGGVRRWETIGVGEPA